MASREGEPFTHFLSLEMKSDKLLTEFEGKLKELQNDLKHTLDTGIPTKLESLHVTMGTLRIHEVELEEVSKRIKNAVENYVDMLNATNGLVVSFRGIEFGDYGVIWTKMKLGSNSAQVLRKLLEEEVGDYLTDYRFQPHVTIYRKCISSAEMRQRVQTTVKEVNLGCVNLEVATLRKRKEGSDIKEPLWTLPLGKL